MRQFDQRRVLGRGGEFKELRAGVVERGAEIFRPRQQPHRALSLRQPVGHHLGGKLGAVEIDAADLMRAIRSALTDVVQRETQAAVNALRGRID